MKLYKKTLAILFLGLLALQTSAMVPNDEPIAFGDLPLAAQTLIKDHFNHLTMARASFDVDLPCKNYEVVLSDNTLIDFDNEGNWSTIKCEGRAVPELLVPEAIAACIQTQHANAYVTKLARTDLQWVVLLSNEVKLTFDSHFNIVESQVSSNDTEGVTIED